MSFDSRLLNGVGVLVAIVETGSFVRAADNLGLTQSGVSRAVARLEARIGIRLFDRTTRIVALTDEGRRFYQQVAPLLSGIEEASIIASGAAATVQGRLRINIDAFFAQLILAPRLKEFMDAYPALELQLITRDTLGDLVADGFDVGLRFGAPPASNVVAQRLLETPILTLAAPAYLKRHGHPQHPRDLEAGHERVDFINPITGRAFAWEFHKGKKIVKLVTPGRLAMTDGVSMIRACLAGYGVAQVFALGMQEHLDTGRLINLFPDWPDEKFPLHAYHPSRHLPPAKVRAFLDFVIKLIKDLH